LGSLLHPGIKGSIIGVKTYHIIQEKKFEMLQAVWKVVLTAAWDAQGIYILEFWTLGYLQKQVTVSQHCGP
jgi:hypothetical protein